MYQVECGAWGSPFLIVLAVFLGLYIGAPIARESRSGGGAGKPLLQLHPHFLRWVAVSGLVMDGAAYARAGGASFSCFSGVFQWKM